MKQFSIGDKYELNFNSDNSNNDKFEIRGIIDDKVIILKTEIGSYILETIKHFVFLIESGKMKLIEDGGNE